MKARVCPTLLFTDGKPRHSELQEDFLKGTDNFVVISGGQIEKYKQYRYQFQIFHISVQNLK